MRSRAVRRPWTPYAMALAVILAALTACTNSSSPTVTLRPSAVGELPTTPDFFPLAVWLESVVEPHDAELDSAAGLNTYLVPTSNSSLPMIREAGMYAVLETPMPDAGAESVGWFIGDEMDMTPGFPTGVKLMDEARRKVPSTDAIWANFGKGVLFWLSRDQAADFVATADVVSADAYWYTDTNLCSAYEGGRLVGDEQPLDKASCHRASNYGAVIDELRRLDRSGGKTPIWAFVEVGHPAKESSWPTITPSQVRAAVWSSLIHGASGIAYFNHSFGGPCQTQHALREPCYAETRAMVTQVNDQIRRLAPALNSPDLNGLVRSPDGVDVRVTSHDGMLYVFAGTTTPRTRSVQFSIPCLGTTDVTVDAEDRSLQAVNGEFSDTFEGDVGVHVYVMKGGSCLDKG